MFSEVDATADNITLVERRPINTTCVLCGKATTVVTMITPRLWFPSYRSRELCSLSTEPNSDCCAIAS